MRGCKSKFEQMILSGTSMHFLLKVNPQRIDIILLIIFSVIYDYELVYRIVIGSRQKMFHAISIILKLYFLYSLGSYFILYEIIL